MPADAGDVTVSRFELEQDCTSPCCAEDEIDARAERIMVNVFDAISPVSQDKKVPLPTAAFIIGCHRVSRSTIGGGARSAPRTSTMGTITVPVSCEQCLL